MLNCTAAPWAHRLHLRRHQQFHSMTRSVRNIAHRGASGTFPENTLAAFRAAIEAGAQMCELDVQLTCDRAVVVMHDDTVDRTTDGHGAVADLTLEELKRLDAGARFKDGARRGERVPTLDEVFEAVAGRCALNVELKEAGFERKVAAIMRKWRATGDSMVSSFDWHALEAMRTVDPEIRAGVLAEKDPKKLIGAAVRMRAYSVNPRFDMVTREFCERAHQDGLMVLTWTVDAPELMRYLIDAGVDGIMTNYPERMRALGSG
jgi:glycerophosphoryl diester phosphodiesterase